MNAKYGATSILLVIMMMVVVVVVACQAVDGSF
jgi:hypothetical protein